MSSEALGYASKAVFASNIFLNIILGTALQELFGAMRKLTIMVHLLIMNVRIPANAQYFFAGLLSFVTFDLIDLGPYIVRVFNLYDDEMLNENLSDLGYGSNYFMVNIGSLLIVIAYLFFLLVFYASTHFIKHKKFMHYRNKMVEGLLWNKIISFVSEAYMQLTISCIMNFLAFRFTSFGPSFSTIAAILSFVVCVGFPIFSFCFLYKNRDKLRAYKFKEKFEALYEGLNYKRGHYIVLAEPAFSCARVLLLIGSLILLQNYRYFQIFVANATITFIIIYTGLATPY
jgi:hypothetical protein